MSSDPLGDVPSAGAERPSPPGSELSLATLVRARGTALLEALERHRPGSGDHAAGTASFAFALAAELGYERDRAEAIRETARLHDVGLVYVPAPVLAKPAAELAAGDRALLAASLGKGAGLARGAGVPEEACAWLAASGERFDGRGPGGLAGERIPREARLIRAACACDVALSRPMPAGGEAGARERAIDELRRAAGAELDPDVTAALVALLGRIVT